MSRAPNIIVPSPKDPSFNDRVAEILELWTGARNDGLDRVLTVRDEILSAAWDGSSAPSSSVTGDDTPPGMPTNMSVVAKGMNAHRISWQNPYDEDLYYIEIYRGTTDDFFDADKIAVVTIIDEFGEFMFRDISGYEPDVKYYYWLVAVDWSRNKSDPAFVGAAEIIDNPSLDDIISSLLGDIEYSHLNTYLSEAIDTVSILDGEMTSVQTTITEELDHETGLVYAALANMVAISTYEGDMAAIQVILEAYADDLGDLFAEYFVKLDVNGYVSGFGIVNDGGTSSTIFRTDRFIIAIPGGSLEKAPFILGTTADGDNQIVLNSDLFVDGAISARMINGTDFGNLTISSGSLTFSSAGKMYVTSGNGIEVTSTGGIDVLAGGDINLKGSGGDAGQINLYGTTGTLVGTLTGSSATYVGLQGTTEDSNLYLDGWDFLLIEANHLTLRGNEGLALTSGAHIYLQYSGTTIAQVISTGLHPANDSTYNLGTAALAWSNFYADTASIGGNLGAATGNFLIYNSGFSSRCYIDAPGATSSYYSLIARTSAEANAFYVRGDKEVWCDSGVWYTSDEREKENIVDIDEPVGGQMLLLNAKKFNRLGKSEREVGFLADDLQGKVLGAVKSFRHPRYNKELRKISRPILDDNGNETGEYVEDEVWSGEESLTDDPLLAIKNGPIVTYLVKWGQEKQMMIDALSARLESIESELFIKEKA